MAKLKVTIEASYDIDVTIGEDTQTMQLSHEAFQALQEAITDWDVADFDKSL